MNKDVDKKQATLIGYTRFKKPAYCPDDVRHCFVCGTTGAGKSVGISNFVKRAVKNNDMGLLVVDGKGDVGSGSLFDFVSECCKHYKRPLYVINMNTPELSAKYNPLRNASGTVAKDLLVNLTNWSEEHYKVNCERYIQRLVQSMCAGERKLSFNAIVKNMPAEKFEALSKSLQKDGKISKEQHIDNLELIATSGKIAEQAAARFSTIAESDVGVLLDDENGIDIYTALQSGAVIMFILNPLLYPETASALGRLMLVDAKQAVHKMYERNVNRRTFFVLDEIATYAGNNTALIDLINKSRSAGVTCIAATQSMSDLEAAAGEAFKNQILENTNTYLLMRQNSPKSAEEVAKICGTQEGVNMTYQIGEEGSPTGLGTAKFERSFILHPDEVKAFKTGEAMFLCRDNGKGERIKVVKPTPN